MMNMHDGKCAGTVIKAVLTQQRMETFKALQDDKPNYTQDTL